MLNNLKVNPSLPTPITMCQHPPSDLTFLNFTILKATEVIQVEGCGTSSYVCNTLAPYMEVKVCTVEAMVM